MSSLTAHSTLVTSICQLISSSGHINEITPAETISALWSDVVNRICECDCIRLIISTRDGDMVSSRQTSVLHKYKKDNVYTAQTLAANLRTWWRCCPLFIQSMPCITSRKPGTKRHIFIFIFFFIFRLHSHFLVENNKSFQSRKVEKMTFFSSDKSNVENFLLDQAYNVVFIFS